MLDPVNVERMFFESISTLCHFQWFLTSFIPVFHFDPDEISKPHNGLRKETINFNMQPLSEDISAHYGWLFDAQFPWKIISQNINVQCV